MIGIPYFLVGIDLLQKRGIIWLMSFYRAIMTIGIPLVVEVVGTQDHLLTMSTVVTGIYPLILVRILGIYVGSTVGV